MNLKQMMERALQQGGMDESDLPEYRELLTGALNTAYDGLVRAARGGHVGMGEDEEPPLRGERDIPDVPEWTHRGLCDYGTWALLRSGGPARQARAGLFLHGYEEVVCRARGDGQTKFIHVPE